MKLLTILMVLAVVAGMSFAVDFGGSTEVGVTANADEQKIAVIQEIDIDLGPLHVDLDGELDYDSMIVESINVGHASGEYEIGAELAVSVFAFGGTIAGDDVLALGDITAFVGIAVGDVGADVSTLLSADAENDAFQGAEFSAFWNPGPLELRVGYLLTSEGAGDENAPEAFDNGGAYATAKISY